MGSRDVVPVPDLGTIGDRYQIVRKLGRGGMAAVYEVCDRVTGACVALKRLELAGPAQRLDHVAELFEREFVIMSRLAHPRIVEVYDYGHDRDRPFYTLELLDGGDLHQMAPVPWRQACTILLDVCSALSLLHSRRQVHRDVTTRNVRCTRDGKAKLIDFGAMVPFGPSRQIVGSPPFTAPEVLACQALDGRADLYSLGATAYRALTGRHAYPVRSFTELRQAFHKHQLAPPSHFAPDIPEELDQLVLSLLQLQPIARPASAAEVMERLSAIASVPLDEELVVRQAYLDTPNLEGRAGSQARARRALLRAREGRGGGVLVVGAAGTGRSRFLDTCVVEAKLLDVRVARADAGAAGTGPWGAVRALIRHLLVAYGEVAFAELSPHAAVVADLMPELTEALRERGVRVVPAGFETPQAYRAAVCDAVTKLVIALGRHHPLAFGLDDLDRIDEPSAALLSSVAHATRREPVVVFATSLPVSDPAGGTAISLFSEAARVISLNNLCVNDTEALLSSVFGDVPNVKLMADRLFGVTRGNPRDVMAMAQHLLEQGLVRYEGGAWSLPGHVETSDLPASMGEAQAVQVERLPKRCRLLVSGLALVSLEWMSLAQCEALGLHSSRGELLADLQRLTGEGVLVEGGRRYAVAQPVVRRLLAERMDGATARDLHRRLADMFEASGGDPFRVATHALSAGEQERAVAAMKVYAELARSQFSSHTSGFERVRRLPPGSYETETAILEIARRAGEDRAAIFWLNGCLLYDGVLDGGSPVEPLEEMLAQTYRDCGLDIYESLDGAEDEATRLYRALQLAQERFDGAPASERVCSPAEAIPLMAQLIVAAIGIAGRGNDLPLLERTPALGPLAALDPALQMIDMNHRATMQVLAGHLRSARAIFAEILERFEEGDREGRDQSHMMYMRLAVQYTMGALGVNMGYADTEHWARLIEDNPSFVVNAARLRMLAALRQGNWDEATRHRKRLELMRIQNSPPQLFEGSYLLSELLALIDAEDLVRVKRMIPALVALAEEMPSWEPMLGLARGAYHMLRGDLQYALSVLQSQLATVEPARHVAWPSLEKCRITCLYKMGRLQEAVVVGRAAEKVSRERELDSGLTYAMQSLAPALAALGEHEEAFALVDAVIERVAPAGSSGVLVGMVHEARARVALHAGDTARFEESSARCAAQYRAGHNPVLTAKYERLMQLAREGNVCVSPELADAAKFTTGRDLNATLRDTLSSCTSLEDRARLALETLVQQFSCSQGFLYIMGPGGPTLSAQKGQEPPPGTLEGWLRRYLDDMFTTDDPETQMATAADSHPMPSLESDGAPLVPLVLSHRAAGKTVVTGVAALRVSSESRIVQDGKVEVLSGVLADSGDAATAVVAGR